MTSIIKNRWHSLRRYTSARIALGRAGSALPTSVNLQFQLDHARARDAVHLPLDTTALISDLDRTGLQVIKVHSQAVDRSDYLRRPDLGRQLQADDHDTLLRLADNSDIVIVIADGLSSTAVQRHTNPLLDKLIPALREAGFSIAPIVLVTQGRVAIGDSIAQALGARLSLVLIGERPGLSSPDSLGIYLTYAPRPGRSDAERNCISNIRPPEGLSYAQAVDTCLYLCRNAMQRKLSGVALKDDSVTLEQHETTQIPFFRTSE